MDQAMQAAPAGSRAIVVVTDTNGDTSHAFNVVRDDHGVAYLDGQAGGRATAPRQPARIRFMPVTDGIPEPRTITDSSALSGPDLIGAIGLEIEVPVVLHSDQELYYNDVIAQGPGIQIKVDKQAGRWVPEVVTAPGAVMPGETRPDGTATDLVQQALTVTRTLQALPSGDTRTPLQTIVDVLDGFEVVGKGHGILVHHMSTNRRNPYSQYTVGVPYAGLRSLLEYVRDYVRAGESRSYPLLLLDVGLVIASELSASMPSDPRHGPSDVDVLIGVLALAYPHIVAEPLARRYIGRAVVPLNKNFLAVGSRISFRAIRSGLPQSVRSFLTQHAQQIRAEFVTAMWRFLIEEFGEREAHRVMRQEMVFDKDAPGPVPYRFGGDINDYLNNLLFDQHDDQGNPVSFVSQKFVAGISTHFDELDTKGGLSYPLAVVELRYHNHLADLDGVHRIFGQLHDLTAGLIPSDAPHEDVERMAAANERANASAFVAMGELAVAMDRWERVFAPRRIDIAEANLRQAERDLTAAETNLRYATEFRASVGRADALSTLGQRAHTIEHNATIHVERAQSHHRIANADLAAARDSRQFIAADRARFDAVSWTIARAVNVNMLNTNTNMLNTNANRETGSQQQQMPALAATITATQEAVTLAQESLRSAVHYCAGADPVTTPPSQLEGARTLTRTATAQTEIANTNHHNAVRNLVATVRQAGVPGLNDANTAVTTLTQTAEQLSIQWRQLDSHNARSDLSRFDTAMQNLALVREAVALTQDHLRHVENTAGLVTDDLHRIEIRATATALARRSRAVFHTAALNVINAALTVDPYSRTNPAELAIIIGDRANAMLSEENAILAEANTQWQHQHTIDPTNPTQLQNRIEDAEFNHHLAQQLREYADLNLNHATHHQQRHAVLNDADVRKQWANRLATIAADLGTAIRAQQEQARANLNQVRAHGLVGRADPTWSPVPSQYSMVEFGRRYGWLAQVNPWSDRGGEFVTNCVLTAIATDMTLADRLDPVTVDDNAHFQAPPATVQPAGDLSNYTGNAYREVPDYGAVDEVMWAAPMGSRGIMVVTDVNGETSHAFNVVRDDHGVAYLDGQAGGQATAPRLPARIRFMPVTTGIAEPRTFTDAQAPAGPDLIGAIGLEVEVPVVLRSTTELAYNDVIAQGPGIRIKVDSSGGEKIPEVITSPGAVLPGETRFGGTAQELQQRVLKVTQALTALPSSGQATLRELLLGLEGFEAVGKGLDTVVHRRTARVRTETYTQYTVGVPYTGLRPLLEFTVRENTEVGEEAPDPFDSLPAWVLHEGLNWARQFSSSFRESEPRRGPNDEDVLIGVLALVYPHLAAEALYQAESLEGEEYLGKHFLQAASRMTFRAIRSGLPEPVRAFLTRHAGEIKAEFVNGLLPMLSFRYGNHIAHSAMRQTPSIVVEEPSDGSAGGYRIGGFINDYLNNLVFDERSDQGHPIPYIDQIQSFGIYSQFRELDSRGGLSYPLIAVELRYHLDDRDPSLVFPKIQELAAGLTPSDLSHQDADRLAEAHEHANNQAAQMFTDLADMLTRWENTYGTDANDPQRLATAEANHQRAERDLATAEADLRYAAEFRSTIDNTDSLAELQQRTRAIEAVASDNLLQAQRNHRAATADLDVAGNGLTLTSVDEQRRDTATQAVNHTIELNLANTLNTLNLNAPDVAVTQQLPELNTAISVTQEAVAAAQSSLRQAISYHADLDPTTTPLRQRELARQLQETATIQAEVANTNHHNAIFNLVTIAQQNGVDGLADVNYAATTLNWNTADLNAQWGHPQIRNAADPTRFDVALHNLTLARQAADISRDNVRHVENTVGSGDAHYSPAFTDAIALARQSRTMLHAAAANLIEATATVDPNQRANPADFAIAMGEQANSVILELNTAMAEANAQWHYRHATADPTGPGQARALIEEARFNDQLAQRLLNLAGDNLALAIHHQRLHSGLPDTDVRAAWAGHRVTVATEREAVARSHQAEAHANLHAVEVEPSGDRSRNGPEPETNRSPPDLSVARETEAVPADQVGRADPSWLLMPGLQSYSGREFGQRYGWLDQVNPSLRDGGEFVTNCVLSAIATDMTLADRLTADDGDVYYQAPPTSVQSATDLSNYTGNSFRDVPDYQAVDEVMRVAPVGSRAVVVVTDIDRDASHAFNVVRDDHGIAYLDGQAGGWATAPRQPARIRFMPVAGQITEPRTVTGEPSTSGPDLVGAIEFTSKGAGTNLRRSAEIDGEQWHFNTGHGFNRAHHGPGGTMNDLRTTTLTPDQVEGAIAGHVNAYRSGGGVIPRAGVGDPHQGFVSVGGANIGYRVAQTPDGAFRVSTYWNHSWN
ncbi:toxin glutamine deamidase domain-containing protein [Salinispora arenicola]|uniref:toxin glutamine deamidase domain-containing protein n=1 Tax=Salinispora arenicola TaxID=168697 RepID=UPI0022A8CE5C|nr:toxin glutamine deamidase domain-containing protein [Salinispora arenicola]